MKKFKDWFDSKLIVGAFPYKVNKQFDPHGIDIVINVSDEWYVEYENLLIEAFVRTYWFPMNECKRDIGLNSIYGAMHILRFAERRNLTVYLHCHAGVNRSQIIRAAYYYMRTGKQLQIDRSIGFENMLVASCARGYLPPKAEMQRFLNGLTVEMQGGKLDSAKIEAIHNF